MKKSVMFVVALASLASTGAHAQSTLAAPRETLGTYVVDNGPGLDTGCSYRGEGPLLIDVPVPVVVNPAEVNSSGFLVNPQKLIDNQVIGRFVTISFPAYDVDNEATGLQPGESPEVDRITFNGKVYGSGRMAGKNGLWVMQQFSVEVSELKFGSAKNQLRIDIDTANVGVGELWCTAVDWVAVKVDVAAPYVLAHGISSSLASWDEASAPGVLTYLNGLGVAFNRFSVPGIGSATENGRDLGNSILAWLQTMKADRVHIIGHSKGGLDAQAMAGQKPGFRVLSLSTLSTPHMGSVSADLAYLEYLRVKNYDEIENASADPNGWVNQYLNDVWTALHTPFANPPKPPGLLDLRTSSYQPALKAGMRGNISPTFSIGASADANNNGRLDSSEANGMPAGGSEAIFDASWTVTRDYLSAREVTVKKTPGILFGTTTTLVFETTSANTPQENDIVVSQRSANPPYATPLGNVIANHTTVKSAANIDSIIDRTITLR